MSKPQPTGNDPVVFDLGIPDKMVTATTASAPVPANTSSATATASLPANQLTDPTNTMRLGLEADFGDGRGFVFMKWGVWWTGAPGNTTAPAATWQFNAAHPPRDVRAVVETRTGVQVTSVSLAFS